MTIAQSYIIYTEPASEPVTLDEAKLHLKMDGISADDTLITALIIAARQLAEEYCGIKFINTVIEEVYDRFPMGTNEIMYLSCGRVTAVDSVKYYDSNDDLQTFNSVNYIVDTYRKSARIGLASSASFPTYDSDRINGVMVRYTSGFGASASSVPEIIKSAIKLTIGHLYLNREDTVKKMPTMVEYILNPYRIDLV